MFLAIGIAYTIMGIAVYRIMDGTVELDSNPLYKDISIAASILWPAMITLLVLTLISAGMRGVL